MVKRVTVWKIQLYVGLSLLVITLISSYFVIQEVYVKSLVIGMTRSTAVWDQVSHEVDNTSSLALTGHIVSNTVLQGQIIITTMYLFGACTIILVGLSLNFIFQGLALQAK